MVGLYKPDQGTVNFDFEIFMTTCQRKTFVKTRDRNAFQGGALFDYMTVGENIMFPLTMFSDASEKEKQSANFCLDRVSLPNAFNLYPSELSGGNDEASCYS